MRKGKVNRGRIARWVREKEGGSWSLTKCLLVEYQLSVMVSMVTGQRVDDIQSRETFCPGRCGDDLPLSPPHRNEGFDLKYLISTIYVSCHRCFAYSMSIITVNADSQVSRSL